MPGRCVCTISFILVFGPILHSAGNCCWIWLRLLLAATSMTKVALRNSVRSCTWAR